MRPDRGSLCPDREVTTDRVEVHQRGGPAGLQLGFVAADVPAFAGAVAVSEQAEEPLDPGSRVPQVRGGHGISERLAGGDQELFVFTEVDVPVRLAGAASVLQQAAATVSP